MFFYCTQKNTANSWIFRDENIHVEWGATFHNDVLRQIPTDKFVHDMMTEVVELEKANIHDMLTGGEEEATATTDEESMYFSGDMTEEKWCQYVEYVADEILSRLQYPKLFFTENPFDWMRKINLDIRSNFFEGTMTIQKKHFTYILFCGCKKKVTSTDYSKAPESKDVDIKDLATVYKSPPTETMDSKPTPRVENKPTLNQMIRQARNKAGQALTRAKAFLNMS